MATATPSRSAVFNLPNQLTLARLVLGVVLFLLIDLGLWVACIVVFALLGGAPCLSAQDERATRLDQHLAGIFETPPPPPQQALAPRPDPFPAGGERGYCWL